MEETTAIVQISPRKDIAIIEIVAQIEEAIAKAEVLVVDSEESTLSATNDLSFIARIKRTLEAKRKEYLDPLRDHTASINEVFKIISEPLGRADKLMRDKVLGYRVEQERQAREAEAIERGKRELAEREAALKGETLPIQPPVPTTHLQPRAVAEGGETNVLTNYSWEVVDKALIPLDYMMPDSAKITKQVRASKGATAIAGLRIFPVTSLRVEAAK